MPEVLTPAICVIGGGPAGIAAARAAVAAGVEVVLVERKGRKALVSIDAIEQPSGKFLNKALTELTLVDPSLSTHKILMPQVAPKSIMPSAQ